MSNYNPEWYLANREAILEKQKQYRADNREKLQELRRRWREENEGRTYATPEGYVKYIGYEHPATNACGVTSEHRIILWDKLSGQDAPCNWCGKQVYWNTGDWHTRLVTDHINNIKDDNRPENLVPSCNLCNVSRPGGQNRKEIPKRQCEASECDRMGVTRASDLETWVCMAHYNQQWRGLDYSPVKPYASRQVSDTHRACRTCEQVKPNEDFYKHSRTTGFQSECKTCMKERAKRNRVGRRANAKS